MTPLQQAGADAVAGWPDPPADVLARLAGILDPVQSRDPAA